MFDGFAAFHHVHRHHQAPAPSLDVRLPARARAPQRLICSWRWNRETRRLECRWQLAGEIAAG